MWVWFDQWSDNKSKHPNSCLWIFDSNVAKSFFDTLAFLTLNRVRRDKMQIITKTIATLDQSEREGEKVGFQGLQIRNCLNSFNCWRFIYFKITSKSSSTEPSVTSVEMYSTLISVMLFMVLNMDGTAGTQNHKPLALVKRPPSNIKNLSNTVSAISYCNGTLYKVTI